MGCAPSCCDDYRETIDREAGMTNPMEAYSDWSARLMGDLGSDAGAVTRDFPRMRVIVLDNQDRKEDGTKAEQVKDSLLRIANIVDEANPSRPQGALQGEIQAQWPNTVDTDALRHSPDLSSGLRALFHKMEFIDAENDKKLGAKGKDPLFQVLLCFAQGTMFYPSQRISHLLWTPFSPRPMDVEWNVFVSTAPVQRAASYAARPGAASPTPPSSASPSAAKSSRPGAATPVDYGSTAAADDDAVRGDAAAADRPADAKIFVTHWQVSRNFVAPSDAKETPQFEVEWAIEIALRGDGSPIQTILTEPVVRVEKRSTSNELYKSRYNRLERAVFAAFEKDLKVVDKL